jgi:uncharacterized protein (UPF0179 family)
VTELRNQNQRILVTSTTNAAVDQALAKLAGLTELQKSFERGQIVRIDQSSADTFGAGLREVVERLNAQQHAQLKTMAKSGAGRTPAVEGLRSNPGQTPDGGPAPTLSLGFGRWEFHWFWWQSLRGPG